MRLLVFLLCFLSVSPVIGQCHKYYRDIIKRSDELEQLRPESDTANYFKAMSEIDERINQLNKIRDKCGFNVQYFIVVKKRWDDFYNQKIEYGQNWRELNVEDFNRFNTRFRTFETTLKEYEIVLFPDTTLMTKLANLQKRADRTADSLKMVFVADKNTKFNGILFFRAIDSIVDSINNQIHSFRQYNDSSLKAISDSAKIIKRTSETTLILLQNKLVPDIDSLKYFMYKRDTSISYLACASAFNDRLYGLGLARVFGRRKSSRPSAFAAAFDFTFPVDSENHKNCGLFLSAGVHNRNYIILAGIGFTNSNKISQNISWKGTFVYLPYKFPVGFGITYSPLTDIGIAVALIR